MHRKPQGRGYIRIRQNPNAPWLVSNSPSEICAHEFHYSSITGLPDNCEYAFEVTRGTGVDGKHDGIIYKNQSYIINVRAVNDAPVIISNPIY